MVNCDRIPTIPYPIYDLESGAFVDNAVVEMARKWAPTGSSEPLYRNLRSVRHSDNT